MSALAVFVIATFTSPEEIGTNPRSMLWLLPLVMAIAAGYKATKLPRITAGNFLKEVLILSASIVSFMAIAALVLFIIARLVTE